MRILMILTLNQKHKFATQFAPLTKFGTYPQKRSADPELRLEGLEV
ncbi:hypothetical protein Brsp02_02808 [Brucella sp. NBRC 113783]